MRVRTQLISRQFDGRRKLRQLAGCVRYLALALAWNLIPLGSIALLAVLISTDQGLELLKIDREISPGIGKQLLRVGVPLLLYTVSVTLASITVARAGARRLGDLAVRYELSASVLERVSRVFIPLSVGYGPLILVSVLTKPDWWVVVLAVP